MACTDSPASRSSRKSGAMSRARALARLVRAMALAAVPPLKYSRQSARIRPPRFLPRAFATANAALVRSAISLASYSATAGEAHGLLRHGRMKSAASWRSPIQHESCVHPRVASGDETCGDLAWGWRLARAWEESMQRGFLSILAACGVAAVIALSSAPTNAKTVKECDAEYAANKAAIKASGQKKADYVAACRAGAATPAATPAAAPAAPAPAPAAAPAPAPTVAAPPPAPAPVVTPAKAKVAAPTGAGGFTTDAQAKGHCPADTVVWVNTKSGIYHFAGTHNYGTTKQGAYMCEADAKAAGDRAAENEKHP